MRREIWLCVWLTVVLGAGDIYGDPGRGFMSRGRSGGWFGGLFSSSAPRSKPPIGWNVNNNKKLAPGGPPPAYPGLESVPINSGSGKIPPPRPPPPYSSLDQPSSGLKTPPPRPPPPYSTLDQSPNGMKSPPPRPPPPYSAVDQSPPPAYSAPVNQPPIVHPVPSAPVMILNAQPAPSSSLFGGGWLSNMIFYGLGSMNSVGSHSTTVHHYHNSTVDGNPSQKLPVSPPVPENVGATLSNGTTTESSSLLNKLKI